MKVKKPDNDTIISMNINTRNDTVEPSFDWRDLKDKTIRENGEFARTYYSLRSIALVAELIKEARSRAQLTQSELAQLAQISQPQLSRLEKAADPVYQKGGSSFLPTQSTLKRIEGPTIGVIGRVLAAAGFKITDIKIEPCRVQSDSS